MRTRKTLLEGEGEGAIKLVRCVVCGADDPRIAAEFGNIGARKKSAAIEIDDLKRQLATTSLAVEPCIVERFGYVIAEKLRDPAGGSGQRAYVQPLVDRATGTPPQMAPKA